MRQYVVIPLPDPILVYNIADRAPWGLYAIASRMPDEDGYESFASIAAEAVGGALVRPWHGSYVSYIAHHFPFYWEAFPLDSKTGDGTNFRLAPGRFIEGDNTDAGWYEVTARLVFGCTWAGLLMSEPRKGEYPDTPCHWYGMDIPQPPVPRTDGTHVTGTVAIDDPEKRVLSVSLRPEDRERLAAIFPHAENLHATLDVHNYLGVRLRSGRMCTLFLEASTEEPIVEARTIWVG